MTVESPPICTDLELEAWVTWGQVAKKRNSNLSWPFPWISGPWTHLRFLCLEVFLVSPNEELNTLLEFFTLK